MSTPVNSVFVHSSGALWLAAIPVQYKVTDYVNDPDGATAPSQVSCLRHAGCLGSVSCVQDNSQIVNGCWWNFWRGWACGARRKLFGGGPDYFVVLDSLPLRDMAWTENDPLRSPGGSTIFGWGLIWSHASIFEMRVLLSENKGCTVAWCNTYLYDLHVKPTY